MKLKLLTLLGALVLISLGLISVNHVLAQSPVSGLFPTFISQLSQKLGIGESQVQQAFDDIQQDRLNQMSLQWEQTLQDAVKAGKLSEAQKNTLLDKLKSYQSQQQLSKQNMMNQRQELRNWAQQNGIDLPSILGGLGMFGGRMGMIGHGMGRWK